ncbi:MAG: hypothetical protein WC260_03540 [Candidatus Pacearchaeota archaeon]
MRIEFLDKSKKKKILEHLNYLGLEKIEGLFLKSGSERIRIYSGDLSKEDILIFYNLLPIESVGLYFAKEILDKRNGQKEIRLSLDGSHLLKEKIKNNIISLDSEQEKKWFFGEDIDLNDEQVEFVKNFKERFVIVQSKSSFDFIGTGKLSVSGIKIYNFLPKERRRKVAVIGN